MTDRLAVILYGRVIGYLERAGTDDPSFTYTSEYAADGIVPLSSRLPITGETYPPQKVAPYLRGLLPENRQTRQQWSDQLDVSADDPFAILAIMGWDCPGAVQFCDANDVSALFAQAQKYVAVTDGDIAERIRALQEQPAAWTMPGEHWSLGGQQEKFALALIDGRWHEAHGAAATTHIFKPGIKVLMQQALVEHVTMRAAGSVGVIVAGSELHAFEDQWAIVVERFDRVAAGNGFLRLHQEDFCQALGRLPEGKYEANGGPGLREMTTLVRRTMPERAGNLLAIADFITMNLVAGAPDGHSKNIALMLGPSGQRSVAPLFDLATGLAYDSATVDRSIAVSIGGERRTSRIRLKQWEKAAKLLELDLDRLVGRVTHLASRYPEAFQDALDELDGVPGVNEVSDRTMPRLEAHCEGILDRLHA